MGTAKKDKAAKETRYPVWLSVPKTGEARYPVIEARGKVSNLIRRMIHHANRIGKDPYPDRRDGFSCVSHYHDRTFRWTVQRRLPADIVTGNCITFGFDIRLRGSGRGTAEELEITKCAHELLRDAKSDIVRAQGLHRWCRKRDNPKFGYDASSALKELARCVEGHQSKPSVSPKKLLNAIHLYFKAEKKFGFA